MANLDGAAQAPRRAWLSAALATHTAALRPHLVWAAHALLDEAAPAGELDGVRFADRFAAEAIGAFMGYPATEPSTIGAWRTQFEAGAVLASASPRGERGTTGTPSLSCLEKTAPQVK